jgi:hypothetical protein
VDVYFLNSKRVGKELRVRSSHLSPQVEDIWAEFDVDRLRRMWRICSLVWCRKAQRRRGNA